MTKQQLEYANKLADSIRRTENLLKIEDLPIRVVLNYAKRELDVIKYLSEDEITALRCKVRASIESELNKMKIEFSGL